VGAGSSLEAGYTLSGPLGAGTWRLVADGIVLQSVDVTFDIVWRSGGDDQVLASWQRHLDPLPGGEYRAQPFEESAEVEGQQAAEGDQLILRFRGEGSDLPMAYIPNGDGELTGGRIPFIDLPD
jgi:hypothetical protein